jgi:hypothetical protein
MKFEPRFYDLLFTTNVWSVFFYDYYSAQLLHDHLRCCTTPGIAAASAQIASGCFLSSAQADGSPKSWQWLQRFQPPVRKSRCKRKQRRL